MTEPLIKLPSMIMKELEAKIAEQKNEIARKDAEIQRLQEKGILSNGFTSILMEIRWELLMMSRCPEQEEI